MISFVVDPPKAFLWNVDFRPPKTNNYIWKNFGGKIPRHVAQDHKLFSLSNKQSYKINNFNTALIYFLISS